MGQSGGPGEDIVLSGEMRWTLSPWSVHGVVLGCHVSSWGSLGLSPHPVGYSRGGMDASWAHCAWAPGEDLSGPHVHRPQSPLFHAPLQGLGKRTCPVKRGAWVGGLVGPFSDGHTQVWGSVRWPAATRQGHHASAAPFWGLRFPRGGWVRGGGRRDRDMWDGGPGPWVPPRGGVGVMPRGEAAGDGPGCQQAPRRPPQAACGIPAAPGTGHQTGAGLGQGTLPLRPGARRQGAGGRSSAGSGVGRSQATPSPISVSAVTSPSPPCVRVQMPPMRTPAHRPVTLSHPGQLCSDPSAHKVPF